MSDINLTEEEISVRGYMLLTVPQLEEKRAYWEQMRDHPFAQFKDMQDCVQEIDYINEALDRKEAAR